MFKRLTQSALRLGSKALVAVTSTKYLEFLLFAFLDAVVAATTFTQFDDEALAKFKEAYKEKNKGN